MIFDFIITYYLGKINSVNEPSYQSDYKDTTQIINSLLLIF